MKKANREAFGEALVEVGRADPRVLVFDADVCTSTGTWLFRDAFPGRFFQMGIAEQNMVCAAAGCSTVGGFVPWVSTFGAFAARRSLDQVALSVAYPRLNVKINGSYAGIPTGKAGATHQAMHDVAAMRALPSMTIIDPVDAVETRLAVLAATAYEGPVYLRTTRHQSPVILDPAEYRFTWGKAHVLRPGRDIALIGTGTMSVLAMEAAAELASRRIDARVIHVHTVKPLDEEAIVAAGLETRGIVTLENHSVIGGLGSAVCELMGERHPVPVRRIGFPDVFGESGDDAAVYDSLGLSVRNVVACVAQILGERKASGTTGF